MDMGNFIVKCVKVGGDTLSTYGFAASQGQEVDLLDPATPDNIRAFDYWTAENMCRDTGFELAQKIVAGHWQVVSKRMPEIQFTPEE